MEEIKMYKIRWEGQVSDYERGVLRRRYIYQLQRKR